ncbi:cupredoxin domain-containing protein [Candidatus Daviesbacteria bacterium]|nr:cupredoxin domain-containing protein [Candidatus Daviesbacteria bacterium]
MKAPFIIVALIVLLGSGFLLFKSQQTTPSPSTVPQSNQQTSKMQYVFENPKKSAHFESNTPAHGMVLAGIPINVVIDFNFDLAKPSEIKILKDPSASSGQVDYGVGETAIDDNKLAMRRNMDPNSPDGLYKVEYKACWPDSSCHDGNFQFAIDRSLGAGFTDMTNKKETEIKLSQIMFDPQNIKISKGTKVTWINDDGVEHYINTDSHPAHTYYIAQNSKALKKGESYSIVFERNGIYLYHCSAHADSMVGNILVE